MVTRRDFLKVGSLFIGSLAVPEWLFAAAEASLSAKKDSIFLFIIQRGAMDGLSLLAPFSDPEYLKFRPNIAVNTQGTKDHFTIDSHFALHPAASALQSLWKNSELSFVVQAGSPDSTRSHFDAQDFLESGMPGNKAIHDGFLSRALGEIPNKGNLTAIALQPSMPRVLQGNSLAISMNSLKDYSLKGLYEQSVQTMGNFEAMYQSASDKALRDTGISAFHSMENIQSKTSEKCFNDFIKQFPKKPTGRRLGEIAWMIKTGVDLRLAVTDIGGWDTHTYQGDGNGGRLSDRIQELSEAIASFKEALGKDWSRVVLVTATEFGRTVAENGTKGTDHGHGSVMMIAGGNVRGGRVLGKWGELKKANLFEERDVPVTTDFREVFSEVLAVHLGLANTAKIFPHWTKPREPLKIFG